MPAGPSNGDRSAAAFPMSGVLAILVGGGLLLAYWKFSGFLVNFTSVERYAFVGVLAFVTLWGVRQLVDARQSASAGSPRTRKSSATNGGSSQQTAGWSISWVGIILILAGIELLLTFRTLVPSGIATLWVVLFGLLCIFFGLRKILATLLPHRFGRKPQYRVALPKPGAMYLLVMTVLLIGSLIGHSNMLMLVFAMMVGPFVMNGWITFSMLKRTVLTRRIPSSAIAGEPFTVEICLENRKRLLASSVMMATDQVENEVEMLEGHVLFPRVPARSSRMEGYRICLMRRGLYRFGPLHLATRFPLGIVERRLIFPEYAELLVYPRIGQLTEAWKRGRSMSAEIVDRRSPVRGSFHDEFHGMREYRPGDNPRSIHWRTSVRRNELTVREYQENRSQDLLLLIDLWSPEDASAPEQERVEWALSFAATLAVDHMQHARDAKLDVVVTGRDLSRWEGRTGPGGTDSLLSILAEAEAAVKTDVLLLALAAEGQRSSSTRVLLLTTRPNESEFFEAVRQSEVDSNVVSSQAYYDVMPVGPKELQPYLAMEEPVAAGRSRPEGETELPVEREEAGGQAEVGGRL